MQLDVGELGRSPGIYSGQCVTVRGYEVGGLFFEGLDAWKMFRTTGAATIGAYGLRSTNFSADKPDKVELVALAFMCSEYNRRQSAALKREQARIDAEPATGPEKIPAAVVFSDDSFCAYRNDTSSADACSRTDRRFTKSKANQRAAARISACHFARNSARGTSAPRK